MQQQQQQGQQMMAGAQPVAYAMQQIPQQVQMMPMTSVQPAPMMQQGPMLQAAPAVQQTGYGAVNPTPVNGIIGLSPTPRGVFSKYGTLRQLIRALKPYVSFFLPVFTIGFYVLIYF